MLELIYIIMMIVFAIAVGLAAKRRYNRSGFGWFLISFVLLFPPLAFLLLVILGPLPGKQTSASGGINWNRMSAETDRFLVEENQREYSAQQNRAAGWMGVAIAVTVVVLILIMMAH